MSDNGPGRHRVSLGGTPPPTVSRQKKLWITGVVWGLGAVAAVALIVGAVNRDTHPAPPAAASGGHVHEAESTPAGEAAQANRRQVEQDRAAASSDPGAKAAQQWMDEVTGGTLAFEPDTAEFTAEGRAEVDRVAEMLTATPTARIKVVGHTAVEISDPALCLALSEQRAGVVLQALTARGVDPSRLSVIGLSHSEPKDRREESRRVELLALPAG